ncbi:L-rhamnose mutarotase [Pelagibacterium sp. H642]|uniref:L-rhamnose mutarotase n=1 Tax=Pelagibacterium sp. H642 TaxID=1881069 RepID=UPI00281654B9|nr:L-rhamnose mutarotase [Pelagibacterium sp. H642]WMT91696.1 L-rhamnose mutarotase [Pelagibacterium sp. H642]
MPERIAFRMNLNPGRAAEYRRRHDEILPELAALLREAGVSDYSIWLDPETHHLFATLVRTDDHTMDRLPENEIMARWWAMMGDIMQTHPDNSPVEVKLERVFQLD